MQATASTPAAPEQLQAKIHSLNEAYRVLSNSQLRREYDEVLAQQTSAEGSWSDRAHQLRRQQEAALHGADAAALSRSDAFHGISNGPSSCADNAKPRRKRPRTYVSLLEFDVEEQDDAGRIWTRPCRCGQEFIVEEADLLPNRDEDGIDVEGARDVECGGCGELVGLEDVQEALAEG